jgi:hypothetical protein
LCYAICNICAKDLRGMLNALASIGPKKRKANLGMHFADAKPVPVSRCKVLVWLVYMQDVCHYLTLSCLTLTHPRGVGGFGGGACELYLTLTGPNIDYRNACIASPHIP